MTDDELKSVYETDDDRSDEEIEELQRTAFAEAARDLEAAGIQPDPSRWPWSELQKG